ncbi:hypothetical protein BD414DRAFT_537014 [Trametes punicea]|nr:hypothetical protein BD414DRAFT_537014 [Trametes punicea]
MTAQPPQLPLTPPLHGPTAASASLAQVHRTPHRRTKRDSKYIANPVKMFDHIVMHPIGWPDEALQWMGVPRRLPTTPPSTTTELPQGVMSAALRQTYQRIGDTLKRGQKVPREDLSNLVVEAFASIAETQDVFIYRRAKAYLTLGEMLVRMEPMHGFSGSGIAPVLAYLDEPFRSAQRAKLMCWRGSHVVPKQARQADERIDVMDLAMLLAYAQEHKRWGISPDADGNHITRIMYPNETGDVMTVLTVATPAETLQGIQDGHDTLKRIKYSRQTVEVLGSAEEGGWQCSPLLQLVWTLVDEASRLAAKAPTPRWPIGPWAWTTHF